MREALVDNNACQCRRATMATSPGAAVCSWTLNGGAKPSTWPAYARPTRIGYGVAAALDDSTKSWWSAERWVCRGGGAGGMRDYLSAAPLAR